MPDQHPGPRTAWNRYARLLRGGCAGQGFVDDEFRSCRSSATAQAERVRSDGLQVALTFQHGSRAARTFSVATGCNGTGQSTPTCSSRRSASRSPAPSRAVCRWPTVPQESIHAGSGQENASPISSPVRCRLLRGSSSLPVSLLSMRLPNCAMNCKVASRDGCRSALRFSRRIPRDIFP